MHGPETGIIPLLDEIACLDANQPQLCVIQEEHRCLVGFSLNNKLYFYRVCPFGGKFSAFW